MHVKLYRAAAVGLLLLSGCADGLARELRWRKFEFSQGHMGTTFRLVLYAPDERAAEPAAEAAFERIAQLDGIMSDYRETSELMRLCRKAGGPPVRLSPDLFRVLARAQEVARASGGAFDVTAGPVIRLWRRARRTGSLPDRERLARALALTGYDKLHLDARARTARLDLAGMQLDLGGIAKGYAADEALAALKRRGIRSALVAAGGDVAVGAPPPGATGWKVRLSPLNGERAGGRELLLREAAVSTSGDAVQYVEIGGVRYSHIVDPRTGMGLTGHASVTVVARRGISTDAWATALSVLGPERGLPLIEARRGTAALIRQSGAGGEARVIASRRWASVPQTSS